MTDRFSKTVAIKAVDDDEMIATGVVMTPYELDHQLDWLDPDGIEAMYNPSPDDGVMHASFPDGHATLEFNEVLDEPQTIDGVEFDAGEWVIRRRYENERRWQLVKDGILSAYSIGGGVSEVEEYQTVDDLPDEVDVSKVDPELVSERYWPPAKIIDGEVSEISDVDIGAVPSSDMAVVKGSGLREKNLFDQADDVEEFAEIMQARGHSVEEATRLWDYLERTKASDVNEPAESGVGASDKDVMSNDTDDGASEQTADASKVGDVGEVDDATLGARIKSVLGFGSEADDGSSSEDSDAVAEKAGRTLSKRNVSLAKEIHDDAEEMLRAEGADCHSATARTYHEDKSDPYERGDHYDEKAAETTGAESPADDETTKTNMSDGDDLSEKVDALEEQLTELSEKLDDADEDADAEKTDEQADENPLAEKLDALTEQIEKLDERVDKVAKGTAESDQVTGTDTEKTSEEADETSAFKAALGSH